MKNKIKNRFASHIKNMYAVFYTVKNWKRKENNRKKHQSLFFLSQTICNALKLSGILCSHDDGNLNLLLLSYLKKSPGCFSH